MAKRKTKPPRRLIARIAHAAGVSAETLEFRLILRFVYSCGGAALVYAGSRSLALTAAAIPMLYTGVWLSLLIRTYVTPTWAYKTLWVLMWGTISGLLMTGVFASYDQEPYDWEMAAFWIFAMTILVATRGLEIGPYPPLALRESEL